MNNSENYEVILLLLNLLLTTVGKCLNGQLQKMVLAFHILTCQAWSSIVIIVYCLVYYYLVISLGAGSIVIIPSNDFTTFENNTLTFTFNCSGNGRTVVWIVDGYTTGTQYVLSKEIQPTPSIVSPDGLTVSSQLIVPTTKTNRNITVICTVLDRSYQPHSSNPVRFTLQG